MATPKGTLHFPAHNCNPGPLDLCKKGDHDSYDQLFRNLHARRKKKRLYKGNNCTQCLMYAAAQGNLEAVRKLVEVFKFNPMLVCNGPSPLHCAIAYGHMEIVKYLVIEKGCSPETELKAANSCKLQKKRVIHGIHDIPGSLLFVCNLNEYDKSVSKYSLNERPIEVSHIHVEILKFLFDHGWTYNGSYDINNVLKFLMMSASVDDLVYLIDHNHLLVKEIIPVLKGLITDSAGTVNIEMLEYLMHKGALSVSVYMIESIVHHNTSDELYLSLLEHCTEDTIVLLGSVCRYKLPVLSKAIAERNLNSQDSAGRTPLHIACEYNYLELVSFLVSQQCDQSIADADGYLALHVACMHSSLEALKLLSFSEKDKTNQVGNTAVHIACEKMREDIIEYLIKDKNCAVNVLNNKRELPLHIIIYKWYSEE